MYSIFDLFKVGVGPSSSHTVGPMIAAFRFAKECVDTLRPADSTHPPISSVKIRLYGSLALTGAGHSTDVAILAGLSGYLPDRTDPSVIQANSQRIRDSKRLMLAGQIEIAFDAKEDLIWMYKETLPQHPNAIQFQAFSASGDCLFEDQYFSTGGGFVYSQQEFRDRFQQRTDNKNVADLETAPYPFRSAKELVEICRKEHLSIDALIHRNELVHREEAEIASKLDLLWDVMSNCIERGCMASGILPGSLHIPRRAPMIFHKLAPTDVEIVVPLSSDWLPARPTTPLLASATKGTYVDPLRQLDWVSL